MTEFSKIAYIYGLSSSLDPDNIRYIGYTMYPHKRKIQHIADSKTLKFYNHRWIQSVLNNNGKILMNILKCIDFNKRNEEEVNTIRLFKSAGAKLTNGTSGGNIIEFTSEVKQKLSKVASVRNNTKEKTNNINRIDSLKKDLHKKSNKTKARLNDSSIIKIFELYNSGMSIRELSKELNKNTSTLSYILRGLSYKNIIDKYNLVRREKYINQHK